ncbi:hypothetical protein MTE01_31040 [Microbacterium testaceum]|uniref:Uncharacterized protein n=1 Tax=Microbacterium testaceum TaxID=2033 RepID=A0A4Y3QQG5_MICTE|nr:hypothetical protein MTE01_31040 [Microbacterium testaceum]
MGMARGEACAVAEPACTWRVENPVSAFAAMGHAPFRGGGAGSRGAGPVRGVFGIGPGSHGGVVDDEMCGALLRAAPASRTPWRGWHGRARWYRDRVRIARLLLSGRDETLS